MYVSRAASSDVVKASESQEVNVLRTSGEYCVASVF